MTSRSARNFPWRSSWWRRRCWWSYSSWIWIVEKVEQVVVEMGRPNLGLDNVVAVNQQWLGVEVNLENEAVGSDDFEGAKPLVSSFFCLGGDFAL